MIVYERRGTHANVNVVKINRDNWMVRETKYIFPNFVTYVKRVFDGCQKLFCLFSKVLVTVVKNFRNFTSYFGRYWWAAPVINLDQGESSFMAVFSTRGAFFRNAGAKVQFFWAENKNMAKKLEKKSVSIWFIAIYIKLNFAFNIFGKTKVSLRVGHPLLMTPCRNHPAKWHSFRKNFLQLVIYLIFR